MFVKTASNANVDLTKRVKTLDGVKIKRGDVVLLRYQKKAVENGVYIQAGLFRPRLVRITQPPMVTAEQGAANADQEFVRVDDQWPVIAKNFYYRTESDGPEVT